ncbi:MAG: transcriptional regulator, TetR family [Frankiales bacterium]|nr:transcriptional regulator, TetR family [Frankiales bacterium]
MPTARAQLVAAAFELFETEGYDATTVDSIAARAGVGRTTFFRAFKSKDEVVFPDHTRLLAGMQERLESGVGDPQARALDAALFVIRQFLAEGDLAVHRYRLTSTVPALRDRELAMMSRYQRVLGRFFLAEVTGEALAAELLASAWVTVHNHVLRDWMRGRTSTPEKDLTVGLDEALTALSRPAHEEQSIVVFRTSRPLDVVLPGLQTLLGEPVGPRKVPRRR